MILVLVLGGGLGRIVHRARVQREAVAAIERAGGFIMIDYEIFPTYRSEPRAPRWLRRLLGDEYFRDVVVVGLPARGKGATVPGGADDVLAHLAGLSRLKVLMLLGGQATDAGLAHLRGLTGLEDLRIAEASELTDAGVVHLRTLKNLKLLTIQGSRMTDADLAHLAGLNKLEQLAVNGIHITDAGLARLRGLTRLRELTVGGGRCEVTDEGLASLVVVEKRA